MEKLGIVGAKGFLGKTLVEVSKDFDFKTTEITRNNFDKYKDDEFDILINTAMPSKKFWALKNPFLDFQQSVELTADLVFNWNYDKFIHISSISVNEIETKHPYSINKMVAEMIVSSSKSLIVRLGALYGKGLQKGALFDLLNSNKLYVDLNSEYNYISTDFVSRWIFSNIERVGIVELGAVDIISLHEIAKFLDLKIESGERFERVFSSQIESGMPHANEVLKFAKNYTL